jgi:homopolymeric O-antigen transport system permease protein
MLALRQAVSPAWRPLRRGYRAKLVLLLSFIQRDFSERYYGSTLGLAWAFAWPLVMIAIFTLVFGGVLGTRLAGSDSPFDYGIFLVAGIVPWNTFAQTITRLSNVYIDRAPILKKIPLPLSFFGVVTAVSDSITLVISFAILMVFMLAFGKPLSLQMLWLVPLMVLTQGLSYSAGMLVGTLSLFVRDIRESVPVLLQVLFWTTPIIYPITILPEPMRSFERVNPVFLLIDQFHRIIVTNEPPDPVSTLQLLACVGVLVLIVQYAVRTLERHVRDIL